jgi:hypothetical protein
MRWPWQVPNPAHPRWDPPVVRVAVQPHAFSWPWDGSTTASGAAACHRNMWSDGRQVVCWLPPWAACHERPLAAPKAGLELPCMLCSRERPWGTFDSGSGAIVCVDCRDGAAALRRMRGATPSADRAVTGLRETIERG